MILVCLYVCMCAYVKGYPPDNTGVNEGQHYVTQYKTAFEHSLILETQTG